MICNALPPQPHAPRLSLAELCDREDSREAVQSRRAGVPRINNSLTPSASALTDSILRSYRGECGLPAALFAAL